MVPPTSRREALRAGATALALLGAGCSSSPGATVTTTDRTEESSSTATASPTPTHTTESCSPSKDSVSGAWPTFAYDPGNTSATPDATGPTTDATALWSFETNGPINTSPTVADGTVYLTDVGRYVYAIEAATGTEQWRFRAGISGTDSPDTHPDFTTMESTPTVVDGTVYVGGGNYEVRSEDGVLDIVTTHHYVYALDAGTGDVEWTFRGGGPIESSPTVVDGTAYFGDVSYFEESAGTVYAVDVADGSERWRFELDRLPSEGIHATPAVANGTVYVGSGGDDGTGMVYALDAADGSVIWRYDAESIVSVAPSTADGRVYLGLNNGQAVIALSAADGEVRWEYPTGSIVAGSPAVANGIVYDGDQPSGGGGGGFLHAIDARTGENVWAELADGYLRTTPAVADGAVYVGDMDHRVYAFDAGDGTPLWEYETGDSVQSSPTVVDDVVFVGSDDGRLHALAEPDC